MKKIISLLLCLISLNAFSQTMYKNYSVVAIDSNISVPRYLIGYNDIKTDTLGIVITISQAQKIDNDLELLDLYRNMKFDCDSSVNYLLQVVDDYKKLNVLAQSKFTAYESAISDEKSQINNLKEQIAIKESEIDIKNSIISDKDGIINIDKTQINFLKKEVTGVIIVGGVSIGGLLYLLIKK